MSKKYVLLITCTVGYGHQAAAMNIEQALRRENPEIEILLLDTRQYFPSLVGKLSDQWDNQLRKGRFSISEVVNFQGPYEYFYEWFLDRRLSRDILKLFEQYPIDTVYDMQPVLTHIIYKAIAKACQKNQRTVPYHKILTDLPTHRNLSYFTGLKQTKIQPQTPLKIHAPDPLLRAGETTESFWRKHCKLPSSHLDETYALPVNPHYLQKPSNPNTLTIKVESEWKIDLHLSDDIYVTSLMMGSQGVNIIYDYVLRYLDQLEKTQPKQPHYFFIACSKNEALYNSLRELLINHPLHQTTPHRIIPLRMQTMDAVASLMWRSDQIIIRSGGISSLEQLAISRGRKDNPPKLWIHSGYRGEDPGALLNHIYTWERGNAEYLMQFSGAKVTTPKMIEFFA